MQLPLVQIDAFADARPSPGWPERAAPALSVVPFTGNPAAVMPLPHWLPDALLQQIAEENNLSETAFVVAALPDGVSAPEPSAPAYHLRWFTPAIEVTLCGHATLATAAHLFTSAHPSADRLWFHSLSGWLTVRRDPFDHGLLELDFPADDLRPVDADPAVLAALGLSEDDVEAVFQSLDLIVVVRSASLVADLAPDHTALARFDQRGVIVTAAGDDPATDGPDVVSRWFGAGAGVGEDPVTGSAHSQIAPYWAQRLGRDELRARQLSRRGGELRCRVVGDRVLIAGRWRGYLLGTVELPDSRQ